MSRDISMFKLIGLERVQSKEKVIATCELLNKEETFKSRIQMTDKQKESLWKYVETDWKNKKVAKIEHDGLSKGGIPINPVITAIWNS